MSEKQPKRRSQKNKTEKEVLQAKSLSMVERALRVVRHEDKCGGCCVAT